MAYILHVPSLLQSSQSIKKFIYCCFKVFLANIVLYTTALFNRLACFIMYVSTVTSRPSSLTQRNIYSSICLTIFRYNSKYICPTQSIVYCISTVESAFCCFELFFCLFVFHTGSTVQLELKWLIISTRQNTDLIPRHQLESLVLKLKK